MSGWRRSPKLLATKLEKIKRQVARETAGETGKVVRTVDAQARKRVFPAKVVSKQDDPRGSGFRQGRSKSDFYNVDWAPSSDGIKVKVQATGHYTGARTPAVLALFRRLGRERALERDSLLVKRGSKGGPAVRLYFSRAPLLKIWAEREDKGGQIRRHVTMLDKAMLAALILVPTLEKSSKAVIAAWRRGVQKGFLG